MWSCKRCSLHNYDNNISCTACYKLRDDINAKSVSEYINKLKNKLNEQATEIKQLTELNISLTNSFEDYKHDTEAEIQRLTIKMDTQRSSSVTALSQQMFAKLLDGEDQYNMQIEQYETKIKYLEQNLANKNIKILFGCSIDQLVPKCLKTQQRLIYSRLFSGYIRNYNKNVSHNVIQLISYFYPIFSADYIADFMEAESLSIVSIASEHSFVGPTQSNVNTFQWSWNAANNDNVNVINDNAINEVRTTNNDIFTRENVHKITEEVIEKLLSEKQQFRAPQQPRYTEIEERKNVESDDGEGSFDDDGSSFDDDYDSEYDELSKRQLIEQLKDEKKKNIQTEKQRQDSLHTLHNNMFQKMLDAEFEYEEEIDGLLKILSDIEDDFKSVAVLFGFTVHELIPKYLCKGMKIQCGLLFSGYMKQYMDKEVVPHVIIDLITQFYPVMMSEQYKKWVQIEDV